MHRVVCVWTRWGDYVLGVRDVRPGESLTVGLQPLVRFRDGTARVCSAPTAGERELLVGETVTVTVGELDYTLCCSEPAEVATFAASRRPWALLDAALLGVLVAASFWHAASAPHVLGSGIGAVAPQRPFASAELAEEQPLREGVFAVVAEQAAEGLRLPGDMRCGRREMGGNFADAPGRYAVQGPADNPDPHLARPVSGAGYPTARGTFAPFGQQQQQPGSNGPTVPWGHDAALGTEASSALAHMWGAELQEAPGEGGLGLAGRAGGIVKRFDLAPVADDGTAQLRVVHTDLRVTGARKPSEISRAMAARFAEFRACGEGVEPAVRHDVELDFEVDATGRVVASGAADGALEQCLDRSIAGVAFAPGASDVSRVVYPLHFVAANVELEGPPVVRPWAALPCDCGG